MRNLASATLEDIELLILGGAWRELPSDIQNILRLELQDTARSHTSSKFEHSLAAHILAEHDFRYSFSERKKE